MNKALKAIGISGTVIGTCALVSFVHEYRRMRKAEEKLDSLPLHRLKAKFADVKKDGEKTVIEIPGDMPYVDRLRVCADILSARKRDAEV